MIVEWQGKRPCIAETAFIAPNAAIIGDVTIGEGASVWYGAVLRGDFGAIEVKAGANIQDNAVVHTEAGRITVIGENATIGHGVVLEACSVEPGAVVGMNAVVMNGAVIGMESMIAAGAVVGERMEVPPHHLAAGVPAVLKKELSGRSLEWVRMAAPEYRELAATYLREHLGDPDLDSLPTG